MKKIILAMVVVTTTVMVSNAQVRFGAKAGLNVYNLNGNSVEGSDIKSKIGFNFGGLVNIPASSHFSVQPEIYYSIEGARLTEGSDRINYNLNYLNIPILAQFNSASGFYAELGPQIGFLMSAKVDSKIGGVSTDEDVKDQFKGSNFSIAAGAGFRTSSGFGFGARYNLGMGNILDDNSEELKSTGFQVGVSMLFGGKKSGDAKK